MTAPKVGDRVRVVIEGEVTQAHAGGAWFDIGQSTVRASAAASVEVLLPPEPEWQRGDVLVHASDGTIFVRTRAGTWTSSLTSEFSPGDISNWWKRGTLTLLVRNGKPVES